MYSHVWLLLLLLLLLLLQLLMLLLLLLRPLPPFVPLSTRTHRFSRNFSFPIENHCFLAEFLFEFSYFSKKENVSCFQKAHEPSQKWWFSYRETVSSGDYMAITRVLLHSKLYHVCNSFDAPHWTRFSWTRFSLSAESFNVGTHVPLISDFFSDQHWKTHEKQGPKMEPNI